MDIIRALYSIKRGHPENPQLQSISAEHTTENFVLDSMKKLFIFIKFSARLSFVVTARLRLIKKGEGEGEGKKYNVSAHPVRPSPF